jgi:hypothetical protein
MQGVRLERGAPLRTDGVEDFESACGYVTQSNYLISGRKPGIVVATYLVTRR